MSSSFVQVGFTDITTNIDSRKIPLASYSHHFFEASLNMRRPQGLKGIIAQFGHNIIQKKLDPVPRVNSCPRGFSCCAKLDSSYQVSKIAEIFWVNQQGALEKLDPGR